MVILYEGLLSVEGDVHKHQVWFLSNDFCVELVSKTMLAENFGQFC